MNILRLIQMPLYIKDDEAAELVARLAKLRSLTKQDAVWLAIQVELDRPKKAIPLRARVQALQAAHSLPSLTGRSADKGFFDDLSGDFDDLCGCVSPECDHCRGAGGRHALILDDEIGGSRLWSRSSRASGA
jgi:hypothetical protein